MSLVPSILCAIVLATAWTPLVVASGECVSRPPLPDHMEALPPLPSNITQAIQDYLMNVTLSPCKELGPVTPSATAFAMTIVFGNQVQHINYGCTDKRTPNITVTSETIFRLGSVSKVYTVATILKAADDGKIASLDDPVSAYAADFTPKNPFGKQGPTWRQLMSQLGGLQREVPCTGNCSLTTEEGLRRMSKTRLILPPNVLPSYSNVAFDVMGHIAAERLYKYNDFGDFLAAKLTGPLNQTSTGVRLTPDVVKRMVKNYLAATGHAAPVHGLGWQNPDGGVYSTGKDMGKFVNYWLTKWRECAFHRENMQPKFINPSYQSGFGAPWEFVASNGYEVRTKTGNLAGVTALVNLVPELAFGFSVMWNGESIPLFGDNGVPAVLNNMLIPWVRNTVEAAWVEGVSTAPAGFDASVYDGVYMGAFPLKISTSATTKRIVMTSGFGSFYLVHVPTEAEYGQFTFQFMRDRSKPQVPGCMVPEFLGIEGSYVTFGTDAKQKVYCTVPGQFYGVKFFKQ